MRFIAPTIIATVFAGTGQAQDCSMLGNEAIIRMCTELVSGEMTTIEFCEKAVEFEQADADQIPICVDMISRALPQIREYHANEIRTGRQEPREGSAWTTYSWNNEFTDLPMSKLSTTSNEVVDCSISNSAPAKLVLSCSQGIMAVEIESPCYVSDRLDDYGSINYRIGRHPAVRRDFTVNETNSSLGLWDDEDALPLILEMFDSKIAIFQFTPYNRPTATVRFNLAGFVEDSWILRDACFW